jgi:thymidylate kinase
MHSTKLLRGGQLLVLEGLDGSGKSTLSAALETELRARSIECVRVSFPGRTPQTLGALVYDIHHSGHERFSSLSPTSLQALHVAAHIDSIESTICPALRQGKVVILDRFWWSMWAYGLAAGIPKSSLLALKRLELLHWGSVRPRVVFLLRRDSVSRDHQTEYARSVARAYSVLADSERRHYAVHVLDNAVAPDVVARDALTRAALIKAKPRARQQRMLPLGESPSRASPVVFAKLSPAKPTIVFDTYWRFAAARQSVFFERLSGRPPPWTTDRILLQNKFTNAYRASDRVSQYLIQHVIYSGPSEPDEVFFRTILFKLFNKIETWERLKRELGTLAYCDFSVERYDRVLTAAQRAGDSIYSGAYIMPTGGTRGPSGPKHRMHLALLDRMMRDELPRRVFEARSMQQVFDLLRSYPTIGDFLAYQYATDLNYSPLMTHSEMEFVVPGPGARDGIRKCFSDLGGLTETEIIRLIADQQEFEFGRLGLAFRDLWGRPLQLVDCQNLFCEVDKYARAKHPEVSGVSGRTRIKQRFRPRAEPLKVWYPPKWALNERIPGVSRGAPAVGPSMSEARAVIRPTLG